MDINSSPRKQTLKWDFGAGLHNPQLSRRITLIIIDVILVVRCSGATGKIFLELN